MPKELAPSQPIDTDPVEPMPQYHSPEEAQKAKLTTGQRLENLKRNGILACIALAEFQDKGGYRMCPYQGEPMTMAYFASILGCGSRHIRKLAQAGREAMRAENLLPPPIFAKLKEANLRPLLALPGVKDKEEAILEAHEAFQAELEAQAWNDSKSGPKGPHDKPPKFGTRHIADAVAKRLPPKPLGRPVDLEAKALKLCNDLLDVCADLAASSYVVRDLERAVKAARQEAGKLHQQNKVGGQVTD